MRNIIFWASFIFSVVFCYGPFLIKDLPLPPDLIFTGALLLFILWNFCAYLLIKSPDFIELLMYHKSSE